MEQEAQSFSPISVSRHTLPELDVLIFLQEVKYFFLKVYYMQLDFVPVWWWNTNSAGITGI